MFVSFYGISRVNWRGKDLEIFGDNGRVIGEVPNQVSSQTGGSFRKDGDCFVIEVCFERYPTFRAYLQVENEEDEDGIRAILEERLKPYTSEEEEED